MQMVKKNILAERYEIALHSSSKMVSDIAELTCSSEVSVKHWIKGRAIPPKIKMKVIAEYLKVSEKKLEKSFNE